MGRSSDMIYEALARLKDKTSKDLSDFNALDHSIRYEVVGKLITITEAAMLSLTKTEQPVTIPIIGVLKIKDGVKIVADVKSKFVEETDADLGNLTESEQKDLTDRIKSAMLSNKLKKKQSRIVETDMRKFKFTIPE